MITIRWSRYEGTEVSGFKLFRSMIGFSFDSLSVSDSIIGSTLSLKANDSSRQDITFDSAEDIIGQINSVLVGAKAWPSNMSSLIFIRSDIREAPGSIEVLPCTAAAILDIKPRLITELSENQFISGFAAPIDAGEEVMFEDLDGSIYDYYSISCLDAVGDESDKGPWMKSTDTIAPLCTIEGIVVDAQGSRVPDIEVVAKIEIPPNTLGAAMATVMKAPISTLTSPAGRFSLPILQGAVIRLTINSIGYDRMVTVPFQSHVQLEDLITDEKERF